MAVFWFSVLHTRLLYRTRGRFCATLKKALYNGVGEEVVVVGGGGGGGGGG